MIPDGAKAQSSRDENSAESVVKLEFDLQDATLPIIIVSDLAKCRFKLEEIIPHDTECCTAFYSIEGGDPNRVLELAREHITSEAQLLNHSNTGGLLEVHVMDSLPTMFLAARGALPRRPIVEDGKMSIAVEVPPEYDANKIVSQFKEAYPDATLIARRQQSYFTPLFSQREFEQDISGLLTGRQYEALEVAHSEGYYNWPRGATGEQLSEKLGVSPPTFHQHLRAAERKLVQLLFEAKFRQNN
jgi:predicted DNA-binding protein (UPF0251 family)